MMFLHEKISVKDIFATLFLERMLSFQLVNLPVLELLGSTVVPEAIPLASEMRRTWDYHAESSTSRQSEYQINV